MRTPSNKFHNVTTHELERQRAEIEAVIQHRARERELHETIGEAVQELMEMKGKPYLPIPTEALGRVLMNLYSKEDPTLVKAE